MTSVCLIPSGIFLVDSLVGWIIAASENDFCKVFFLNLHFVLMQCRVVDLKETVP